MIDLVVVPKHVNAIFLSQGLYDLALEDCEKALQFNECNYKALFRKAKSLKEMGRHQEAYDAVAKCSLAVPQVSKKHPGAKVVQRLDQTGPNCVFFVRIPVLYG